MNSPDMKQAVWCEVGEGVSLLVNWYLNDGHNPCLTLTICPPPQPQLLTATRPSFDPLPANSHPPCLVPLSCLPSQACPNGPCLSVPSSGADLNTPSPCLRKNCEFGAECVVKDGQAVCECPDACPQTQDPVCGSDGHTYSSHCEMRSVGCALQKKIHIQHRGPCVETCRNCLFGAICDGQTGRCVCPTECVDSHQPVCGSDGTTYSNECELNVRACTQQQDLRVVAQGECKVCGNTVCAWGARCVQNKCDCPQCQGQLISPVCGSDGVTYDNACELRVTSCILKKRIQVAKPGSCDEDGGCEQDRCRTFGGSWDEDAEDDRCVCDFSCHSVPRSQALHCSLTVYGCCRDNVTAALGVGLAGCPSTCLCNPYGSYGGSCDPTSGQCSCKPGVGGQKCDRCEPGFWNFRAIVTEGMSGCTPCNCDAVGSVRDDCEQMSGLCSCKTGVKGMKCNVCPDGSKMGMSGCDKGPDAQTSCEEMDCQFGASCVEVNGQAHCECPSPDCGEKNKTKVCGSDGVTYADQCQLMTIACRQDKHISVKHQGQCTETILHHGPATRPTPSPTTPRATPSTAHVKVTMPRHGHTTTSRFGERAEDSRDKNALPPSWVEGLPPPRATEKAGNPSSITTHRPTTHNKPPRTTPPPASSAPSPAQVSPPSPFEDSGSGAPSGDDEEEGSGMMEASGEEPVESIAAVTTPPVVEPRSSCDNSPFGCCPDGRTAAINSEGTNCPPTMKFSGFLHLDQVEGQEVFYTPEMEDPKSELFGETARSIESALNELFRKSDVQKDFKSVRVRNLAPSNSILAFVEAHFDPDTRYTVEDIEGALLKQLKAAKESAIVVKKPEEDNIRFNNYGLSTLPFFTTTTTTMATVTTPTTTTSLPSIRRPGTTRRPYTSRRTTTPAPVTMPAPAPTSTLSPIITTLIRNRPGPHPKKLLRPCDSHPCRHGGTCEEVGDDFTCTCPAGRGGVVCEKVIKYFIPSFGGKSYLAFPTMKAYHTVRIAMEFRASEMTGLLLFNGQNGKRDFLSLALVSGQVQLRFNTGSGTGTLISKVRVKPGRWHQLVVNRNRRNAMLSLVGCIRMLDVNNMVYNLQEKGGDVMYGTAVGECGNNPCQPNPCKNGALCQVREAEMFHCKCINGFSGPTCADARNPCDPNRCHPSSQCQVLPEGGYKCDCPMGREGAHCERESRNGKNEAFMPFFSGDSYLELKGLQTYGSDLQQKVSISVVFLANDSNGMIFYNGQKNDGKGDFISLALNDGILEFRYDLGKGPAVIRSKERIRMNVWNTVNLERASRKGEISVNNRDHVRGESPNQHTALNLKESLFVGGAPDFSKLARAASLKDGFKGAIQKITLMGTPILKRENALRSSDVSMFPHHPCTRDGPSNICQHGGLCTPVLDHYECVCQHGFSGTNCQNAIIEKSAGETESIAFDGRTFIEYHNAVTKSEKALLVNKFELSIKTEATHGLILWSGKGVERSDYIALAVVDGRVQMTYDLGSKPVVLQSSVRINTNRWVHIKASRALRDGSLQVGNEAAVTGSSPLAATQLDTDGALWLGGLEESSVARRLPKAYSTGFVGCVKDVTVDGVELHLVEDALNNPKILHCSAK
ncbi:hypothetical protein JZ751_014857 [Albula glossodonta]|uniref:Agrin n=1 Tax=Albula glossodonta TaxID=121402 RepID=A0A8T2N4K2_9TELE|nr:hypothetical protein JZ751_014857 [Albula glossodonta]